MYCVLPSLDSCTVVAAGADSHAHMWRLEAPPHMTLADSYRLPQARYAGLHLCDMVELQRVPSQASLVLGSSCSGGIAVWDVWRRQLLVAVHVSPHMVRPCAVDLMRQLRQRQRRLALRAQQQQRAAAAEGGLQGQPGSGGGKARHGGLGVTVGGQGPLPGAGTGLVSLTHQVPESADEQAVGVAAQQGQQHREQQPEQSLPPVGSSPASTKPGPGLVGLAPPAGLTQFTPVAPTAAAAAIHQYQHMGGAGGGGSGGAGADLGGLGCAAGPSRVAATPLMMPMSTSQAGRTTGGWGYSTGGRGAWGSTMCSSEAGAGGCLVEWEPELLSPSNPLMLLALMTDQQEGAAGTAAAGTGAADEAAAGARLGMVLVEQGMAYVLPPLMLLPGAGTSGAVSPLHGRHLLCCAVQGPSCVLVTQAGQVVLWDVVHGGASWVLSVEEPESESLRDGAGIRNVGQAGALEARVGAAAGLRKAAAAAAACSAVAAFCGETAAAVAVGKVLLLCKWQAD